MALTDNPFDVCPLITETHYICRTHNIKMPNIQRISNDGNQFANLPFNTITSTKHKICLNSDWNKVLGITIYINVIFLHLLRRLPSKIGVNNY